MENNVKVLRGKAAELQASTISFNCQGGYSDFLNDLNSYTSDLDNIDGIKSASLKADNNYLRLNSCGSMYWKVKYN